MRFRTETAAAALLVAGVGLFGAPLANATPTPIIGSKSVSVIGSIAASPNDLLAAITSLGTLTFNTLVWAGSGSGEMTNSTTPTGADLPAGTSISNNPVLNLTNLGASNSFPLNSADGSFHSASSVTVGSNTFFPSIVGTTGSAASGSESATIYLVGNFLPAGTTSDGGSYITNTASLTMALTENCAGGCSESNQNSISMSATLSAPAAPPPPPPEAPEPASLSLLGVGLLGLGAFRRRKS
jgi:hypothetical protein